MTSESSVGSRPPPSLQLPFQTTLVSKSRDCQVFNICVISAYNIVTTVTSDSALVSTWIKDTYHLTSTTFPNVIGLDYTAHTNTAIISTLQLSHANRCLIVQMLHSMNPDIQDLADFLSDPRFTFVGVGIKNKVDEIFQEHELVVKKVVDLRSLAAEKLQRKDIRHKGLAGLAKEVMDVDVPNTPSEEIGSQDEINGYACVDAFLSFKIGSKLFDSVL